MRALFVGSGATAQCYYRCALPAMALGHDWIGLVGTPPDVRYVTGLVGSGTEKPIFTDYDVIVFQAPRPEWRTLLQTLRGQGIKVLIEVDDYLQAIPKLKDHDFAKQFGKSVVEGMLTNMRMVDGLIVSTDWLAAKYRNINRNIWVCQNGLDLARYQLTRPRREHVHIGWAGGTGHRTAILQWLPAVANVMRDHPDTRFVTIGQPFADALMGKFPGRTLSLPWLPVETYPCAMCMFDVAIAPAINNAFYRGKSDLRFLEAAALGIPLIASPDVYPTIEDQITGFHAATVDEAEEDLRLLVADRELRDDVGRAARGWVTEHRNVKTLSAQWQAAFLEASGQPST